MWGVTLIVFSCGILDQVVSHGIKVDCQEYYDDPPFSNKSPSKLKALKAELITENGRNQFNISWAINIDSSNKYLTGTLIDVPPDAYFCKYNPPLATANLTGFKQVWFHHTVRALSTRGGIQASNVPWPPSGSGIVSIYTDPIIRHAVKQTPIPDNVTVTKTAEPNATDSYTHTPGPKTTHPPENENRFTAALEMAFGGLAVLLIITSCWIAYNSGANFAALLGVKMLQTSPTVPMSVLLVYPAENVIFQRAVVALAEFLQMYGGCSVAVDMWQQGKIAELGPVRWLVERTKAADRVLIVCPQPSEAPSPSHPDNDLRAPTIPAAARDLYPLILNTVASHSKNSKELAKFWVVQLGKQKDQERGNLPVEIRACKRFGLMKDLNKLCRSLHTQGKDDNNKKAFLIHRPRIFFNENSTVKLKEAVEKLDGHKRGTFRELEPLNSGAA